ncbi:hypothetical protein DM02DRAFT_102181 [Periconia macrospinosa]|uniref:Uncharacterized protein n=1 Tax=Periconia macrospinosa TaxID=97972 RepID=A0A2V1DH08_9PLEO|nr:hypothetical protein DM02DRAFT_102181 [Periconia macrospinosa]
MLARDAPWLEAHQSKKEEEDVSSILSEDSSLGSPGFHRTSTSQPASTMSFPTSAISPGPPGPGIPVSMPFSPWSSKFLQSKPTESTQWPPKTTLKTSTSTPTSNQAYSDLNSTPITDASTASSTPPSSYSPGDSADHRPKWPKKQGDHTPIYAAAGIISVVTVASIVLFLFFCMRKRKRQALAATVAGAQMKERENARTNNVQAYMAVPPPPLTREPSYTAPPRGSPPPLDVPRTPPPVILGPILGGPNSNYFTGIDTSDMVSVTSNEQHHSAGHDDRTGLSNPFADSNSLNEEPPPPYRPRSAAFASSRGSSLRASSDSMAPISSSSSLSHGRGGTGTMRSPFDDSHHVHEDSDSVSTISDHGPNYSIARRMSAVSDLSPVDRVPAL